MLTELTFGESRNVLAIYLILSLSRIVTDSLQPLRSNCRWVRSTAAAEEIICTSTSLLERERFANTYDARVSTYLR